MRKLYEFKPMLGPPDEWPVGSTEWAERMSNLLQLHTSTVTQSTVHFLRDHLRAIFSATPRPWEVWPKPPYGTPDDYCLAVTGHNWKALLASVAEFTGDKDLVPEKLMGELARAQKEHRKPGRPPLNRAIGTNKVSRGSNNSQHLLRRLARSHPDILAAYERGEYKSVRAAAKAAGTIKQPSTLEQIQKLWGKLNKDGRRDHLEWTLSQCVTCGRPGLWDGRPGPNPANHYCDACCDERAMNEATA